MNGQVRVTFNNDDYNKIIELTHRCFNSEDEISKKSKIFYDKIMKFSYIKDNKVIINLYPSEARFLINILNRNSVPISLTKNWFEELKLKKEGKPIDDE